MMMQQQAQLPLLLLSLLLRKLWCDRIDRRNGMERKIGEMSQFLNHTNFPATARFPMHGKNIMSVKN